MSESQREPAASYTRETVDAVEPAWLWPVRIIAGLALVGLAVAGLAVTDFATKYAEYYWLLVIPIFALVSVRIWEKRDGFHFDWRLFRQQLFHWLGFLIAIQVVFQLVQTGTIDRNSAGLVSLVLLSLTTYLAGVHFDVVLIFVALLLAIAALMASYVEQYMWIILVVLALIIGVLLFVRRKRSHRPATM
jgi:hypothetical protein